MRKMNIKSDTMKKINISLIVLVLIVSAAVVHDYVFQDKIEYQSIINSNQSNSGKEIAFYNLIDNYPDSEYADSANLRLKEINKFKAKKILEEARQDSIEAAKTAENERLRKEKLEKNRRELEALKSKFNYNEDSFTGIGWYKHKEIPAEVKKFDWTDTKFTRSSYIETPVKSSGFVYIKSIYASSDWIFHERIAAKIGDELIYSETIPSYSDDNQRDVTAYGIKEVIHFLNKDNGILESIANSNNDKITIRQIGKKYNEIELTNTEIQAMKDSYRLSQLLKTLN